MTARNTPRGRPPASTRAAVEETALELFAKHGYASTTIESLAEASSISKTTFFRYFHSKADVIWGVFDTHIDRLRTICDASPTDIPTMTAVRHAVVTALLADTDEHGLWLRRFHLFDTSPDLREEGLKHWNDWATVIADFVGRRLDRNATELTPSAIGAAIQAAVLAELRRWSDDSAPASELISRLEEDLVPLCDALQRWLSEAPLSP